MRIKSCGTKGRNWMEIIQEMNIIMLTDNV